MIARRAVQILDRLVELVAGALLLVGLAVERVGGLAELALEAIELLARRLLLGDLLTAALDLVALLFEEALFFLGIAPRLRIGTAALDRLRVALRRSPLALRGSPRLRERVAQLASLGGAERAVAARRERRERGLGRGRIARLHRFGERPRRRPATEVIAERRERIFADAQRARPRALESIDQLADLPERVGTLDTTLFERLEQLVGVVDRRAELGDRCRARRDRLERVPLEGDVVGMEQERRQVGGGAGRGSGAGGAAGSPQRRGRPAPTPARGRPRGRGGEHARRRCSARPRRRVLDREPRRSGSSSRASSRAAVKRPCRAYAWSISDAGSSDGRARDAAATEASVGTATPIAIATRRSPPRIQPERSAASATAIPAAPAANVDAPARTARASRIRRATASVRARSAETSMRTG